MPTVAQYDEFNAKITSIPKSDKLTLHKIMDVERPYGTQSWYVTENRQYRIAIAKGYDFIANHPIAWISITPLTENTPMHDWRIMQDFKNQLCGKENYGVEIYPGESDLMDANDNSHLWVWLDGYKPPFGFRGRAVADPSLNPPGTVLATTQRPFAEKPLGAVSTEAVEKLVLKGNIPLMSVGDAEEIRVAKKRKEARRKKK